MDQILSWGQDAPVGHRHVVRDLRHPALIRVPCDTREMHLSCIDPEKEEDVVGCQTTPCPHLSRQEVSRDEDIHMRANELLPGSGLLTFGGWGHAVTLENVAHGRVADWYSPNP